MATNHYKFTGKERDSESGAPGNGLDYFGARYYSNSLGRFITPDWSATPVGVPYADFADPQTLNLYGYVRDMPTSRVDEDGHGLWNRIKCAFGNSDSCAAQTREDEEKKKKEHERQVRLARFYANQYAKECKCGFDPSKHSDDQLVFLNQHNAFSKTALDPLDPLQLIGLISVGSFPQGAFDDVTRSGSKIPNYDMEVTSEEFGQALEADGYTKGTASDGTPQYTKGNETITVYKQATSTAKPSAQVKVGDEVVLKIRLR